MRRESEARPDALSLQAVVFGKVISAEDSRFPVPLTDALCLLKLDVTFWFKTAQYLHPTSAMSFHKGVGPGERQSSYFLLVQGCEVRISSVEPPPREYDLSIRKRKKMM